MSHVSESAAPGLRLRRSRSLDQAGKTLSLAAVAGLERKQVGYHKALTVILLLQRRDTSIAIDMRIRQRLKISSAEVLTRLMAKIVNNCICSKICITVGHKPIFKLTSTSPSKPTGSLAGSDGGSSVA